MSLPTKLNIDSQLPNEINTLEYPNDTIKLTISASNKELYLAGTQHRYRDLKMTGVKFLSESAIDIKSFISSEHSKSIFSQGFKRFKLYNIYCCCSAHFYFCNLIFLQINLILPCSRANTVFEIPIC